MALRLQLKDTPNKDTIEITSLRTLCKAPKIGLPMVLIHFPPLKSGQPLSVDKLVGPNVSFIEMFHCITPSWKH